MIAALLLATASVAAWFTALGARPAARVQIRFAAVLFAALAVAAGTSGFLFTINPALPFTLLAVLSALFGLTTLWWWRNVTGNITETPST